MKPVTNELVNPVEFDGNKYRKAPQKFGDQRGATSNQKAR